MSHPSNPPKFAWYTHRNIVSTISYYQTPKEIAMCMQVCKSLYTFLNSDHIWWTIYNKAFGAVRVIDQALLSPDKLDGVARKSYMKAKEGLVNVSLKEFSVDPKNSYTAYIYGRLGSLKPSESIVKTFGDRYDLMASFGSVFILSGELSKLCVIAVPNLTGVFAGDTVIIMLDPESKDTEATLSAVEVYTKSCNGKKVLAVINGTKGDAEKIKSKLKGMIETIIVLTEFNEEAIAKVTYNVIKFAPKSSSLTLPHAGPAKAKEPEKPKSKRCKPL